MPSDYRWPKRIRNGRNVFLPSHLRPLNFISSYVSFDWPVEHEAWAWRRRARRVKKQSDIQFVISDGVHALYKYWQLIGHEIWEFRGNVQNVMPSSDKIKIKRILFHIFLGTTHTIDMDVSLTHQSDRLEFRVNNSLNFIHSVCAGIEWLVHVSTGWFVFNCYKFIRQSDNVVNVVVAVVARREAIHVSVYVLPVHCTRCTRQISISFWLIFCCSAVRDSVYSNIKRSRFYCYCGNATTEGAEPRASESEIVFCNANGVHD